MVWGPKRAEYSRLVDRYGEYRQIVWRLNNEVLPEYLPESAIGTAGTKLAMLQKNALVMDNEDELGILMDYCIHDCRGAGGNAVSGYIADSHLDPDCDEYAVVKAMSESFYTLVEVVEVLRGVGVRAADLLADREYLLIDMGLSKSAVKGAVLATRLLPFREFVTTSGVGLPVDRSTLLEIRESILPRFKIEQDGRCVVAGGRRKAADLTAAIIRLCLEGGASDRIRYEQFAAKPSSRQQEPHVNRNAPCPCGSGRKYKKCCGRTA